MTCHLVVTGESGQKLVAVFTYVGGRVVGKAESGHEGLVKGVLEQEHVVAGGTRSVSLKDDPKAWFEALPITYSGSYLRAKMI